MKLAINRNAIDKIPPGDPRHAVITRTYENLDVSQEEFAHLINQGFAFCAQHKNQRRSSNNFTCASFTAADIDHGLRLEEAMEHEFVKHYASVIYTTPNHSDEHHRFRIIFETERDITDPKEMRDAYNGVIKKLGGDPSCKDPCRQFWGCKDSKPKVLGNRLSNSALAELILLGKETQNQHDYVENDSRATSRSTVRSRRTLEIGVEVYDANGNLHRLADLPPSTPIRCPVHVDRNPSAVTLRSRTGVPGLYCSACASTFYESASDSIPTYNFDYGLKGLNEIEAFAFEEIEANPPYFFDKEGDIVAERRDILRIRERYLPPISEHASLLFVKSPKGSGKTQWLESVVNKCKQEKKKVLLIGHRKALIQALAERLKLHSYISLFHTTQGKEDKTVVEFNEPNDHFAVCVDSLPTLLKPTVHKFDVVLVDEVEQVFRHLTSRTLRDRRLEAYEWFKHYVNAASSVYLLDADLNRLTVETVYGFVSNKHRNVQVVINEYKEQNQKIALFESNRHLEFDLMEALAHGKRCFVCSNSKRGVKRLTKMIEEEFGESKQVLAITSDNSQDAEIQQFIKLIKTEILDFNVVLASPSLGTGIDITFPENAPLIDCVYGFFEARVNTHFDIDQQLSRVRHPREINVWISPEVFFFETHPDVVKREVRSAESGIGIFLGLDPDGTEKYHINDGYLDLYANVVAMQRGSKNDLRSNFVNMKKYYGWNVVKVSQDEQAAKEARELAATAREVLEQERIHRLLEAKLITSDEYRILRNQKRKKVSSLDMREKLAMERYEIESFYLREITEDLIKEDNNGKLRKQVRNYERFMSPDMLLLEDDEREFCQGLHTTDRQHHLRQKELLTVLFRSAGILSNTGDFVTDVVITANGLETFVATCRKRKDEIVNLFGIVVRQDISTKATQQLSTFLALLGVRWKRTEKKEGAKKIYEYRILQDSISQMQTLMDTRTTEARREWQKFREETLVNRLFTEENKLQIPKIYYEAVPHRPARRCLVWNDVEY